ncbi:MAG: hypothetical protein CR978_00480 [Gammaproteobacteria bacterium]|nr:MAG: hypothetical protein CR978_00480 [Gammaproteobacteria bacterium]PIE37104.1 MAG: hypothetical protein CSA53_07215 [Gammaproteobacteria bacterium]
MAVIRKIIVFLLVLAMVVVGVLFSLQNETLVPLDALVYTFPERSLSLWVLCAFGIGGLFGMFASMGVMWRLRRQVRNNQREIKRNRQELSQLRAAGLPTGE